MKIGVIADVHGNMHALEGVLDALAEEDVQEIVCVGDLVGYGAHPNEVIDRLRLLDIPCVLGNYDAAVAWDWPAASRRPSSPANEPLKQAALDWAKQTVTADHRHWLRRQPWTVQFLLEGCRVQLIHAGLDYLDEWITPGSPEAAALAGRLAGDVICLGHTHQPFVDRQGDSLLVNPGAVGRSLDRDVRAAYAVLDIGARSATLHRIPYPLAEAAAAIEASSMPAAIARLVRHGLRRIEELPSILEPEPGSEKTL